MATTKQDSLFLSDSDLEKVAQYAKLWESATASGDTATADAAHSAAQQIRAQYGYSGGEDGSQYIPIEDYESPYAQEIQETSQQRDPFSYDPATDPLFQQYRAQYTEAGQDAMEDTLGLISAKTDGLASSYAATASQQTYNNYMDDLNNKIPELQQLAYAMYLDQGDAQQQAFQNYTDLDATAYNRYQTDKNFDYNMAQDNIATQQDDRDFAYQQSQDQQTAIYNAAKLLASLDVMPDEIRKILNLS